MPRQRPGGKGGVEVQFADDTPDRFSATVSAATLSVLDRWSKVPRILKPRGPSKTVSFAALPWGFCTTDERTSVLATCVRGLMFTGPARSWPATHPPLGLRTNAC